MLFELFDYRASMSRVVNSPTTRSSVAPATTGTQLGYARVSTGRPSLDQQVDALTAAGVEPNRIYRDKLSGPSTREQRPGLAALLDYARAGDAIVGIDRLGRNAAEVIATIRELGDRDIVLRSIREGIDTSNATGRMVAGVLASLAELELELGRERRAAAREARRARGQAGDWATQGTRHKPQFRAGTPDARQRRICGHYRNDSRSQPCDGVPSARRAERRNLKRRCFRCIAGTPFSSNHSRARGWGVGWRLVPCRSPSSGADVIPPAAQ
jgi:DNA invertase Pin-like site-specific DNA recombinase